ncbi:MAG: DUF1679 domain-containing protein, partial [Chloroflexi bacterium]
MENLILRSEQITPEWLTGVLRDMGTLLRGHVTCVTTVQEQPAFASILSRLEVTYSGDSSPDAPKKLFLKISNPALAPGEFDPGQLKREIDFYSLVAPLMDRAFVIPCFSVAYDPPTGAVHLLLRDVSDTHAACLTPSKHTCELAVDALACLHASWWDHPRLGKDIGKYPTPEERTQDWLDAEKSTAGFISAVGDQLPPAFRAVYERVLPALPALFQRHATGRNLTLVHGDAHLGNFLFPIDPAAGSVYLLDWQFWHPTIAGTDLAFMMAVEWDPETRRSFEHHLLRRYHQRLREKGVHGYS